MKRLVAGLGLLLVFACSACVPVARVQIRLSPMNYYDLHVVNTCRESLEVYIDGYYATTIYESGMISGISAGHHNLRAENRRLLMAARDIYFDNHHEWVIEC